MRKVLIPRDCFNYYYCHFFLQKLSSKKIQIRRLITIVKSQIFCFLTSKFTTIRHTYLNRAIGEHQNNLLQMLILRMYNCCRLDSFYPNITYPIISMPNLYKYFPIPFSLHLEIFMFLIKIICLSVSSSEIWMELKKGIDSKRFLSCLRYKNNKF